MMGRCSRVTTAIAAFVPAMLLFLVAPGPSQPAGTRRPAVTVARAGAASRPGPTREVLAHLPIQFIPNHGQTDPRVAFSVSGSTSSLFFTRSGVTVSLAGGPLGPSGWTVRQRFPGARAVVPLAGAPGGGTVSYFHGSPSSWRTSIPTFSGIRYPGLWPGVDLTYSGVSGALEYTFDLAAHADPSAIRLAYDGATTRIGLDGSLHVSTPSGGFTDSAPVAFQMVGGKRVPVGAHFVKLPDQSDGCGFAVGAYDRSLPLVIDPVVIGYSGYVGGDEYEDPYGMAVDSSGHAYLMGATHSAEDTFPVKVGPDLHYWGKSDAFVCKVAVDGTSLDYCGYIGGTKWDRGRAIAVDSAGAAYIVGDTKSRPKQEFPVTVGPSLDFGGNADAFICKVTPDGSSLDYCGYIGGHRHDEAKSVAVDATGGAYITGGTHSAASDGFPVAVGPDLTQNGAGDVWVGKVSPDGTHLIFCGYIGGSQDEHARGIDVDAAGNVYVSGSTASRPSDGFPVLVGPSLSFAGGRDAFVTEVSADGTHLVYSGYIGGSKIEEVYGLRSSPGGAAYIAGSTNSPDFITKVGPQLDYGGGPRDAFVTEVAPGGASLVYSGFIGGSGHDDARGGLDLDTSGHAFVTGAAGSKDFPVGGGPDSTYNGGATDAFVSEISVDGSHFVFSGFIGGTGYEQGRGIAVDSATGIVYVGGATSSHQGSFPLKTGPDLTFNGGKTDAFVTSLVPS
jgi:hypothetical protein